MGEKDRAIEIHHVALLAEDKSRRHRQAGADHVADHHLHPKGAGAFADEQAFSEAAALIELDVDDIEAPGQGVDFIQTLHTFVGGDRDHVIDAVEIRLMTSRARLLQ